MNWLFGQLRNPFAHGEWRNGYFYPYSTQCGTQATEAEKIERQWRAAGWQPGINESDRDLLTLAAKAAGIKLARPQDYDDRFRNVTGMAPEGNLLAAPVWNPLTNDGDALRLAVDLKLNIYHDGSLVDVQGKCNGEHIYATEEHGTDPRAATRRAVTRAAAEIGKAMP